MKVVKKRVCVCVCVWCVQAMVHKFIEVVKKRKEGKEGGGIKTLRETLETKRAMRALQLEPVSTLSPHALVP